MAKRWFFIAFLVGILFIASAALAGIVSLFMEVETPITGNVVIIPITGTILSEKAQTFGESIAGATDIVKKIEQASSAPQVKAIIFEINSPGGSVVATEEIVNAIEQSNKTTIAYIREVGASGAYWVAAATDHVIASRMSITGSVGVIASYLEFSGFLDRYNVTYQRLVSGKYKDMGSPFKNLTLEEEALFQEELDTIHEYFLDYVVQKRNLTPSARSTIASAQIFLGVEALKIGLIDEFGGRKEAIRYAEKTLNITADVNELADKGTFFDIFSQAMNENSFFVGKGIGTALLDQQQRNVRILS